MAQAQLKRKCNTFDINLREDLNVKVQRDKQEGVTIAVYHGNKRIKLGLTIWEDLMNNRDQISLAIDFIRGMVGTDWSHFWQQEIAEVREQYGDPLHQAATLPTKSMEASEENEKR